MLFRSIRWRILAWYTLVVTVVTSLAYLLAYVNVSHSVTRETDYLLEQQALELASSLTPTLDGKFVFEMRPEQSRPFRQEEDHAPYYRIWNQEQGRSTVRVPAWIFRILARSVAASVMAVGN
ncbi:sensor histidine kinase N-terminal domain-containing protein [Allorhodopirellula heiligendammensis]|uniref:Two-component sensor kinase N-terminal domain-containing protein n=1 Tax=Allorhodopirellula heiligendammensis TaxID=2714739 RepID=A0A5C6BW73_9BACT|nr:sensor histidine kinase N-terminal domain-containing protein [Allorhodopirellula heiligendammensis]TWU15476.1 hypothetical protein Poly21_26720 [Allorhodopirellula heiligendammensis]